MAPHAARSPPLSTLVAGSYSWTHVGLDRSASLHCFWFSRTDSNLHVSDIFRGIPSNEYVQKIVTRFCLAATISCVSEVCQALLLASSSSSHTASFNPGDCPMKGFAVLIVQVEMEFRGIYTLFRVMQLTYSIGLTVPYRKNIPKALNWKTFFKESVRALWFIHWLLQSVYFVGENCSPGSYLRWCV